MVYIWVSSIFTYLQFFECFSPASNTPVEHFETIQSRFRYFIHGIQYAFTDVGKFIEKTFDFFDLGLGIPRHLGVDQQHFQRDRRRYYGRGRFLFEGEQIAVGTNCVVDTLNNVRS